MNLLDPNAPVFLVVLRLKGGSDVVRLGFGERAPEASVQVIAIIEVYSKVVHGFQWSP